jgi:predicted ATPase
MIAALLAILGAVLWYFLVERPFLKWGSYACESSPGASPRCPYRSGGQIAFDAGQRRAMTLIGAVPHAAWPLMLSLPSDGRYSTLDLTPQQRRQKTLEALRGPVETFACKKPVLMILEDAHWADPTSLPKVYRNP